MSIFRKQVLDDLLVSTCDVQLENMANAVSNRTYNLLILVHIDWALYNKGETVLHILCHWEQTCVSCIHPSLPQGILTRLIEATYANTLAKKS